MELPVQARMGNALGSIPLNLQHEFPFEPQHSKARKTGVIRRNDDDVKIIRIQDVLDLDVIAGDVDGEVRDILHAGPQL